MNAATARAFSRTDPVSAVPPCRRLRTYAVDPSLSARLETNSMNEGILRVAWEDLTPGPVGEYLEVVDLDVDGTVYAPVDLNDPRLLAQDGFPPSEANPQFHQQMVYAVAMKTIGHFEQALGRHVLWRPRPNPANPFDDSQYAQRLRIAPHSFRQSNAYFDPDEVALKFGYFRASANDPVDHVPGATVFSCLSHDIVAHETTHAILDGMHRRFNEPSNADVLAFHEGFADIVALMQHFTVPEVLEYEVARTRGNLEGESILGSLAVQFGRATGGRGALRQAIGTIDENGVWRRLPPDPSAFNKITEPHARGALLVAAVFDAFLTIYKSRTADLYRIYTGGSGVLSAGEIHPDMVRRLAAEAARSANDVLGMCIRAIDYVPSVDITFGEYLRGIITADLELGGADPGGCRLAIIDGFRRRGIYPRDVDTLNVETLRWQGVDIADPSRRYRDIVARLRRFADDCLYIENRQALFRRVRDERSKLHQELKTACEADPGLSMPLGIDPARAFEIHGLRRSERTGPNGARVPQVIVEITQHRDIQIAGGAQTFPFRGGSTLVIDLVKSELKYAIRKRIDHEGRERETAEFVEKELLNPQMAPLLDPNLPNRFLALHSLADSPS